MDDREKDEEIAHIRARLTSLDVERAELEATLGELERQRTSPKCADHHPVLASKRANFDRNVLDDRQGGTLSASVRRSP